MVGSSTSMLGTEFGLEATAAVRSPGRVNLLGEHTDYSLLPVLPMAIDRAVEIAGASSGDGVVAAASATHGPAEPGDRSGWGVYLGAALEALGDRAAGRGARLAVAGDLPATGGLSSSSALTVGIAATLDRLWGLGLGPEELVELAVAAERATGVEGGTMDQTVIVHAAAGHALRIDFMPPTRRHVPVPTSLDFVIGYSGSPAAKSADARSHYNRSVVACRAAAVLLAAMLDRDPREPPVLAAVADSVGPEDVSNLPELSTAAAAAAMARVHVSTITRLSTSVYPRHQQLPVRAAAHHVLTEAARVDAAEVALRAGDGPALGRLFDESHESLRGFGASTAALDSITEAARAAGAHGARLTGAGFGGWAVAVCDPERADAVVAGIGAAHGGPAFRVLPSGGLA